MNTDDALKEALNQVAQAKVAEALGGDVLGKMVKAVMDHRDRSYVARDDTRTAFEKIVDDLLEQAITDAIREQLTDRAGEIKAAVARAFAERGADRFAAEVVDAIATNDWRATLQVKVNRQSGD